MPRAAIAPSLLGMARPERAIAPAVAFAFALVLTGFPASAQELRLTPELVTEVPLGIGAGVDAEYARVRLGMSVRWVPAAYVSLADEVAQAVGGYDDVTSALVRAATEDALALRVSLGARPFGSSPVYIDATYTLLALGGAFTAEDLAEVSGQMPSSDQTRGWELGSTVHQVGLEVGYRLRFDPLTVRLALGGSFTVATDVDARTVGERRFPRAQDAVEEAGAAYLESIYTAYVHLPVFTVAVGWDLHP